jgi:hypothetical protein
VPHDHFAGVIKALENKRDFVFLLCNGSSRAHFILYSFESAVAEFNAFLDVYYPVNIWVTNWLIVEALHPYNLI